MKFKTTTAIFALALTLITGSVFLTRALSTGAASVSADSARNGQLHIIKDCTHFGDDYCTITSSNLPAIKVGSKVYYSQPGAPLTADLGLDSNVVLYVGVGDWAVGRCTLDGNGSGLCTFSDGVGQLAGFTARVNVAYIGGPNYSWNGTYSFSSLPDK